MLKRIGCPLLVVVALGACAMRISERNIVIPRSGTLVPAGASADGVWSAERLELVRGDDAVLRGVLFRKAGAAATVLYFGGNGFVLSLHQDQLLETYRELPVDIAVFDHRGYGASSGEATLENLYGDGVAIHDHLRALPAVSARPLIVHGHSLGSFTAGQVASQRQLDGLVLESSATTTAEWLSGRAGAFAPLVKPLAWLAVDPQLRRQGNATIAKRLDEPTLFVVGERDEVTRPAMARALYRAAPLPEYGKRLTIVPTATHMDAARSDAYRNGFSWLLVAAVRVDKAP